MQIHQLNHLKPHEIEYFHCLHCAFKAKRKDNLKTHVLRHFKKEQVSLQCYVCDFSTKKRDLLTEHIKKHSKLGTQSKDLWYSAKCVLYLLLGGLDIHDTESACHRRLKHALFLLFLCPIFGSKEILLFNIFLICIYKTNFLYIFVLCYTNLKYIRSWLRFDYVRFSGLCLQWTNDRGICRLYFPVL